MYQIIGRYHNGKSEVIDEFDSKKEALEMLTEYKMAYGEGWTFKIRKVEVK